VVVEELRPGNRAWGVGVISLLAFLGRALGMALFAFVDDLPFGWRFAYLVGLFPLGLLVYLRRALPETRRFERAAQGTRTSVASLVRPALALLRAYPGRFAAVGCVGFFWGFSNVVVDFFMPKFVQEAHGWTPAEFVTVSVVGGALGFWGILLAGWLSDRYGRRRSFITFMFLEPIVAVAFFTAAPEWLLPIFAGWVFVGASNSVIGRTYASELFPTSHRSTASGAASVLLAIGMVAGLAIEGTLYPWFSSHWEPVRLIAATGLIAPLVIYLFYEETSGRTLEEIAPERGLRSHADLSTGDARIPIYGR